MKRQDDGPEDGKVLDAVGMRPHGALVPILSLDLIRPEIPDRNSPGEDPTPAIHANRPKEQKDAPRGEGQKRPHWHSHAPVAQGSVRRANSARPLRTWNTWEPRQNPPNTSAPTATMKKPSRT